MPRSSFTKADKKLWESRKRRSDELFHDNGLVAKRGEPSLAIKLMNGYCTKVWDADRPWGGLHPDDLIEVPTIFSVINTQKAQMFAREPEVDVHATSPESVGAARTMERLINHLLRSRKLGWTRQFNRWLDFALILHFGVLRHGFSPSERVFDGDGNRIVRATNVKPDFPWVKAWAPWDVRFDPMAESFHPGGGCRWVAFRDFMLMDEIDRDPGLIKRSDLRPTGPSEEAIHARPDIDRRKREELTDLVEVWTYYDVMERKTFALTEGSENPLMEPKDWEIDWEDGPWSFLGFNEQLNTPFPIPPPMTIRHQAIERNKLRTLMMDLIKRQRNLIGLSSKVKEEDRERLTAAEGPERVEFFEIDGDGANAIVETTVGNFDLQGLLAADERLLEDAREAFGQSRMDRAQRINVETATEAQNVQAGSDLQRGRLMGPWEDGLSNAFATIGQALQSHGVLTDEFTIPILGTQDARELARSRDRSPFVTVRPAAGVREDGAIQGEFVYQIKPGSTAQRDPQREVRETLADLQIAAQFPQLFSIDQLAMNYAVARDLDPTRVLQSPEEIAQVQNALANGGAGPPTESSDPSQLAAILGGGGSLQ